MAEGRPLQRLFALQTFAMPGGTHLAGGAPSEGFLAIARDQAAEILRAYELEVGEIYKLITGLEETGATLRLDPRAPADRYVKIKLGPADPALYASTIASAAELLEALATRRAAS